MANSFTQLLYHVVFSTRDRRALITADLRDDLYGYFGGIVRKLRGTALQIGGVADHVHLLVSLRAETAISEAVSKIKANSSSWLMERLGQANWFGWQIGYGAFTVSASKEETVRVYIRNQEAHHRKKTYKEELMALLTRHGLRFEERYLLG